jgi:hypothetical protein
MSIYNLGKENITPARRNQVPLGESQWRPKPRNPWLEVFPCQFYVPGPLKDGGDGRKSTGRCEKKCAWWKLRVIVGWNQSVEAVAKYGHWNLRTARKYDALLHVQKFWTAEEDDRSLKRNKSGGIIGEIVNRRPHLERLLAVALPVRRVHKNVHPKCTKMSTLLPVQGRESCQPEPPESCQPAEVESCKQGSFRRSSKASRSEPTALRNKAEAHAKADTARQPNPLPRRCPPVTTELPKIATEPGRPPAETWQEAAFRAWDVIRHFNHPWDSYETAMIKRLDHEAADLVIWTLYREMAARKRADVMGWKQLEDPLPISYYLKTAKNFQIQNEDYKQKNLLEAACGRLEKLVGEQSHPALREFIVKLYGRAMEATAEWLEPEQQKYWLECHGFREEVIMEILGYEQLWGDSPDDNCPPEAV